MTRPIEDELDANRRASDVGSVLACGSTAPRRPRADPTVVLAPGAFGTFDGDRWYAPVYVSVRTPDGSTHCRRFDRSETGAIAEHATDLVENRAPEAVWILCRARFADCWPRATLTGIERALADAADRVDATLVTWTSTDASASNGELYDAVISRAYSSD